MASLKGLMREAERGLKSVVTGPHTQWLERPEDEQILSQKAIKHVVKALNKDYKHERSGRFSPSSMGDCDRKVVFGFYGAPQLAADIDNQEMMDHGTWSHLKWQAEGLTVGYMKSAEGWVYDDDLLSGGSMDGILSDGSIFELKTANTHIYKRIVVMDGWPKWENLLQVHNYFILSGVDVASVVYEDRSSGKFHEFRIPRDSKMEAEVLRRLASYKSYVQSDELPRTLDLCKKRMGTEFKRCPYRDICNGAVHGAEFQ